MKPRYMPLPNVMRLPCPFCRRLIPKEALKATFEIDALVYPAHGSCREKFIRRRGSNPTMMTLRANAARDLATLYPVPAIVPTRGSTEAKTSERELTRKRKPSSKFATC